MDRWNAVWYQLELMQRVYRGQSWLPGCQGHTEQLLQGLDKLQIFWNICSHSTNQNKYITNIYVFFSRNVISQRILQRQIFKECEKIVAQTFSLKKHKWSSENWTEKGIKLLLNFNDLNLLVNWQSERPKMQICTSHNISGSCLLNVECNSRYKLASLNLHIQMI